MKVFKSLASVGFGELKKFISNKVIENARCKTIPIPESVIRSQLTKLLGEHNIVVDSLKCSKDGIDIEAKARKMGMKVKYDLQVRIEQLLVNPAEHVARIAVISDSIKGENVAGKIAACIIKLVIDDIVAKSLDFTDSQKVVSYNKISRKATADLIAIRQIALLYETRPILLGNAIVDIFRVDSVSHTDSGLSIHYDLETGILPGIAATAVKKALGV